MQVPEVGDAGVVRHHPALRLGPEGVEVSKTSQGGSYRRSSGIIVVGSDGVAGPAPSASTAVDDGRASWRRWEEKGRREEEGEERSEEIRGRRPRYTHTHTLTHTHAQTSTARNVPQRAHRDDRLSIYPTVVVCSDKEAAKAPPAAGVSDSQTGQTGQRKLRPFHFHTQTRGVATHNRRDRCSRAG